MTLAGKTTCNEDTLHLKTKLHEVSASNCSTDWWFSSCGSGIIFDGLLRLGNVHQGLKKSAPGEGALQSYLVYKPAQVLWYRPYGRKAAC